MEISILGSKKTLNIVKLLLHIQPPCGIIRTTADYFLLPYIDEVIHDFHFTQVVLSILGMTVIGFAMTASFGMCFYMGFFFTEMHPIIPFLLLGIGVDDMFVIVQVIRSVSLKLISTI
jgi:hypothetical protein